VPRYSATRELLASRDDVWAFVSDPHSMARWWPGIEGVSPDRRGFAPGARWAVHGDDKPSLMRKAHHSGALVILKVRPPAFAAWHLTGERFDVELTLEEAEESRTRATVVVQAPWHGALRRRLPNDALRRLYEMCQTGFEPDL
jgi:uncharacterized protein YndB with AHSA1/START domain